MRITLLSAALLATGLASAATPVDGWYTNAFGGYANLPGFINITNQGLYFNKATYISGYDVGGRVGYQSNPIRYEAEYTYISSKINYFRVNNVNQQGVSGTASGNFVMANIYYDTPEILPSIVPFLGLGIGYGYLQTEINSLGPFAPTYFTASNYKFAYQGTLGLTYNFAENFALNISYRYLATGKLPNFGRPFQAQLGNGAVIYRFDKGHYK